MDTAAKKAALEALASRIFAARTTFHKVCLRAGVSPTTISRWRNDIDAMRASTLGRLEAALGEIEREANAVCGLCDRRASDPVAKGCSTFGCPFAVKKSA